MPTHEERRAAARTINTEPTLTDQSQANETDINVIIGRFGVGGTVTATKKEPMYGDFSELPTDLKGFLDARHELEEARLRLPKELRDIPTEELVYMTGEALKAKLTPPEPPKPPEEKK